MPPDGFEPLLETILDNPHDDGPRMVYADWLEERGDQRGEFIRVQLELARLAEDDPQRERLIDRQSELLARHGEEWRAEIPEWARQGCEFRRGFVTEVHIWTPWRRDYGPALSCLAPVEKVTLHHAAQAMEEFGHDPGLRHLRALAILDANMGPNDLKPLCDSEPCAEPLVSLQFMGMRLLDAGALLISLCPFFAKLERLELKRCAIGVPGVQRLADTHRLPGLAALDVSDNDLGNDVLWYLVNSQLMTHLTELCWNDNGLTSDAAQILAAASRAGRLARLELAGNHLGDGAARLLRERFPNLEYLDLARCPLSTGMFMTLKAHFGKRVHLGLPGEQNYGPGGILPIQRAAEFRL